MLTRLELENFKCFEKVALEPGLITVSIGPNGSGKSSVFQALMLLKQSLGRGALVPAGRYVDLGEFGDLVHGHDKREAVAIRFVARRDVVVPPSMFDKPRLQGIINYGVALKEGNVWKVDASADLDGLQLSPGKHRMRRVNYELTTRTAIGHPFLIQLGAIEEDARRSQLESEAARHTRDTLPSLIEQVSGEYERTISGFHLVPAMRGLDKPTYMLGREEAGDFISGEGYDKQTEKLTSTFAYRREYLEDKIAAWFQRITGIRILVSIRPAHEVRIMAEAKGVRVNIVNEGFGSNQLVHLLGQLALAPEHSLICVEEPEIHLHPRAQAKLVQLLLEVAREESKQIWLSTHSEHVLLALLTAVAGGTLKPGDLAIYYFEKEKGASNASKLKVDDKGRVEGGLRGFFEAEVEQLDAYMKALFS
ncbi:MAG: AAA family ATPase [Chloroflexi bacterium]|nr:AAA family ATPase [Chloroflexota bacterium]